jgi:hypothetical protein
MTAIKAHKKPKKTQSEPTKMEMNNKKICVPCYVKNAHKITSLITIF